MAPIERIKASFATDTDRRASCPKGLSPYPFQRAGVEYALGALEQFGSCIIADEPGLGKTIQALCVANELKVEHVLVVCPASLRINWRKEADKWLIYTEAVVLGFEELVRNPDRGLGVWDLMVVDEAHYLKNHETKRLKACFSVQARRHLFLTGTPIVNRPIELWPLLAAIFPSQYGDRQKYGMRYCNGRMVNGSWDYTGASNLLELQKSLRSQIMVRRLKKDVLKDLPPKVRQIIEIPAEAAGASEELATLLRQLKAPNAKALTEKVVSGLKSGDMMPADVIARVRHLQALSKVGPAVAHIRSLIDEVGKVVVFAHHRDVLDQLAAAFPEHVMLRGGMSDKQKDEAVSVFQNTECPVFLGQIQAAGTGLTLTAACTVVFVELDWVPGNMTQCEDRCHRIGQKDSVLVQHLVLEESLDARIAKALLRKQKIIDQALDDDAASAPITMYELA